MPELFDVHLITKNLIKNINKKNIINIVINDKYKQRIKGVELLYNINNKTISNIYSKGKKTFIVIDDVIVIRINYGMVGDFSYSNFGDKNIKISLVFSDNSFINFLDYRCFGNWEVTNIDERIKEMDDEIGIDPLNYPNLYTFNFLETKFNQLLEIYYRGRGRKYSVLKFITDQKLFPGVGNYMKSEILYMSKVSPFSSLSDINENDIRNLFNSYIEMVNSMIRSINYSNDIIVITSNFYSTFSVYERSTDHFGNSVKKIYTKDNRVTYYVENLQ